MLMYYLGKPTESFPCNLSAKNQETRDGSMCRALEKRLSPSYSFLSDQPGHSSVRISTNK